MRNLARYLPVTAAAALLAGAAAAIEAESRILEQPGSPLTITSHEARYQSGSSRYRREGIRHEVSYKNISDRTIVAAQIGLVSFNIFNKFLDRMGGIDMDELAPGASSKGTWIATALADFSFHTGVPYVGKVRFANGEIWKADIDQVVSDLRKIEEDFDASVLGKSRGDD